MKIIQDVKQYQKLHRINNKITRRITLKAAGDEVLQHRQRRLSHLLTLRDKTRERHILNPGPETELLLDVLTHIIVELVID